MDFGESLNFIYFFVLLSSVATFGKVLVSFSPFFL